VSASLVHLHNHTHYSLLDGATRIPDLVQACKQMGMSAVALTDHGNMFGIIEFYQHAVKAGIKPILGLEAYIAPGSRKDRTSKGAGEAAYHIVLLAQDLQGYRNLLKLSSIAYLEGFYYKPRIDKEVLAQFNAGIICTTGCIAGEIPQLLLAGDEAAAVKAAEELASIFGPERLFIEIQDHGLPEQKQTNPVLADIARRKGLGLVATNDTHYLRHEDAEAQDILLCISTGKQLDDPQRMRFGSDQFYLKTPQQMRDLFKDYPEAIDNTLRIAEACDVQLEFKRQTPVFPCPDGKRDADYLRDLVYQGAAVRYGRQVDEVRERIDYELKVIESKGFSSFFLIVHDFMEWARRHGIPCSARGSACSSVAGYCLRISDVDPLRYGLYFERFMDPDRDEMPDIDVDICQDGRQAVIDYVRRKYGHVAQIITFGTLKARAAIRDICRVLGVSLADADRIAKLVPEALHMTIDLALQQEPDLKAEYDSNPQVRKVLEIARRLEGLARHASVHAAGVVVADRPLDDFLPLYKPPDSEHVMTQLQGPEVEKVGLLKMDFLGLRTLTVLERARQWVRQLHGVDIDLETLDLADQKVYEVFSRGLTKGIFQFESGGMKDVLSKMKPSRIEDLIAANALYRPGPMVNIDAYCARKHGQKWTTPHPIMTQVLEETYGIMVYQEQVSKLVHLLGGIELKRAFRLAKAISKKKTAMIEAEREPFLSGAMQRGLTRKAAEAIFEDVLRFGGYAFNKAHSARYAVVAFQTAYMKTYYPAEFMAALLTLESGQIAKVGEYVEECSRRMGIPVNPPDINVSAGDFTPVPDKDGRGHVLFGLAAIKGVGEKAVAEIVRARGEGGPFKSIFDFCERVDLGHVNRSVIEALIKAGAFDKTGAMRRALIEVLDKAIEIGQAAQADRRAGQLSLLEGFDSGEAVRRVEPAIPSSQWSESQMLKYEKEVLGIYVTKHPLTQCSGEMERYSTVSTSELGEYQDGAEVTVGGIITGIRTVITKQGRNVGSKMGILRVEDLSGEVEAIVFPDQLRDHGSDLAQDSIVFLKGKVDRKREQPSLRVIEVIPFKDRFAKLAPDLWIRLHCVALGEGVLDEVHKTIQSCPGDKPVFVEIVTPDGLVATVRSSQRCGIRPTEALMDRLRLLLGSDAVRTSALRRRRANGSPNNNVPNGVSDGGVAGRAAGDVRAAAAEAMDGDGED
jgi:DNA polymerase-3 subunit alpha